MTIGKINYAPATPNDTHTANSSLSTVVTLSNALAGGIIVQAVAENIYMTFDGEDPTAGDSITLYAGNEASYLDISPGMTLKFLEAAATATLKYLFVVGR